MVSLKLMVYCLVSSGLYLLVVSILLDWFERRSGVAGSVPPELLERTGGAWFTVNFLMEMLFYVVIPTITYAFFYLVIPLSGVKAGMAAALVALALGGVPIIMTLSVRVKLSMRYLLFLLLSYLIKISGSLAIIGYLYSL